MKTQSTATQSTYRNGSKIVLIRWGATSEIRATEGAETTTCRVSRGDAATHAARLVAMGFVLHAAQ